MKTSMVTAAVAAALSPYGLPASGSNSAPVETQAEREARLAHAESKIIAAQEKRARRMKRNLRNQQR